MSEHTKKTILLVEDEAIIALAEKRALEKYGYEVVCAASGELAIAAVQDTPAPDLVLMDINLGAGIDGTEAAAIILKGRDIPIVFVSSHTEPEIVEKTEVISSYGYIVKNSSVTVFDASIKMAFKLFEAKKAAQQKEKLLYESGEKYRLLHENAGVGIGYYSSDGVALSFNQRAAKYLNCSPEALIGKSLHELFPKPEAEVYLERIAKAVSSEYPSVYDDTISLPSGSVSFLSTYTKIADPGGTLLGIQVISQDVTRIKQVEEALRSSKERAEMLLNVAAEIIISEAFDGTILLLNESGHKILGYEAPELIGKNFFDLCLPPEIRADVCAYFKGLKAGNIEAIVNHENEVLTKSGERKLIYWHNAVIRDEDGTPAALFSSGEDITGRRKMEADLLAIEGRFKNLLQCHPSLAVQGYEADGTISYWNKASELVYGYSSEEAMGRNIFDLIIPPDMRDKAAEGMKAMLDTGIAIPASEATLKRKDGSSVDLLSSHTLVQSSGGRTELFRFDIDISERKRNEQALRESELKYRSLIESSSDAIFCVDRNGEYKFTNKLFASTFGKSSDYFIGKTFWDIYPKEHADQRYETTKRVFQTGRSESIEVTVPLPDKTLYFYATANPIIDEAGKVVLSLTHAVDISERRRAEIALRDSEIKLKTYFDRSTVSMVLVAMDQGFMDCNEEFCRFIGYSKEEILVRRIADITYPDDLSIGNTELGKIVKGVVKTSTFEKRYIKKDGGLVWGEINICLLSDLANQQPCFLATIVDITERKRAEDAVASLLADKELLLKEVHHRIKNNMNTITGLLSLQAGAIEEPSAIAALQDAGNRLQSMSLLYDKLYQASAYSELSIKDYVSELVDEILGNFPNSRLVRVDKELQDFMLDTRRLQPLGIIINELLTNIMKYAFTGRANGRIAVAASESQGQLRISIHDDGNGLPASISLENSSGFGLQLVSALARQLGGSARIERGQGTLFIVEFPR